VIKQENPALLDSTDVADSGRFWEAAFLPDKLREQPALRFNARDALGRIGRLRPPPGRLLDVGCGWGFFLAEARACGWEPFGLEPLPGPAIHARVAAGATVVADTLRDNTFARETFDVVTSFQVFEHLPDPADVLAKIVGLLRPGGLVLIEVPNIATWSVRLLGRRHRHFVADHLNFFSAETLGALMERAGLEVADRYWPARAMTLRHLLVGWGGRALPPQLSAALGRLPDPLLRQMLRLNMGDIVAVIGRKP
jgi:2-polyprenyl-3-methyl-5-hydroxy-6-metoxy-1,4-benzoquinol methylase